MEFVHTGSRFTTSLNPMTNRANTGKVKPTHRGIARPVALKSAVSSPDTMQGFDEKDSQLERHPITNDGHFPKKLCVWPTSSGGAGLGHTLPGFESSKTWADYCRHFPPEKNYHLAGNLPKPLIKDVGQESMNRIPHGGELGSKKYAASSLDGKFPQHAPSVDALDTTIGGTGESSKRSAFREVAKRQGAGLYNQRESPSTCFSSSSSLASSSLLRQRGGEVRDHPHEMLSEKTLPYGLNSAISVHTPLPPNQLFYSSSSQTLSALGGNVPHNGTELREPFRAPSLIPVKQQLHADFVKHTPEKNHRNPYSPESKVSHINANPTRDTSSGLHFGAFQNNAPTGKILSSMSVPWQQPLFPAGVLPLSSSVSTPQYDNWCAKCNASFRMTSDLVYHMRTQHKRSAEANSAINDKPGAKRSAEEKLKCDFCGETFRERHHLTRHMTSHNNNE